MSLPFRAILTSDFWRFCIKEHFRQSISTLLCTMFWGQTKFLKVSASRRYFLFAGVLMVAFLIEVFTKVNQRSRNSFNQSIFFVDRLLTDLTFNNCSLLGIGWDKFICEMNWHSQLSASLFLSRASIWLVMLLVQRFNPSLFNHNCPNNLLLFLSRDVNCALRYLYESDLKFLQRIDFG